MRSENSSKTLRKELSEQLKAFYRKHKESILDLVIFGSSIKGKAKPNDIDLLVIYKEKEDLELNQQLRKLSPELQVTSKEYNDLFSPKFLAREAYLTGYSVINGPISESLGYSSRMMFRYDLKKLNKTKRMRFYHALYGRNSKGVLEETGSVKFTQTIIIAEMRSSEQLKEFFEQWGIPVVMVPVMIPSRITETIIRSAG